MDKLMRNLIDAAEACFEVEPSPINETWWLKFCTKFVPNEGEKVPCTKHVPNKNGNKRAQKGTKQK